jgi:hypothetical protein
MLTYASRHGHAFIDRELYLPRQWIRTLPGAPRPECLSAGVPFRYFAADSGYGRNPALRAWCHAKDLSYVMAVPVDLPLVDPRGRVARPDRVLARYARRYGNAARAATASRAPLLRLGRGRQQSLANRAARHPSEGPREGFPRASDGSRSRACPDSTAC